MLFNDLLSLSTRMFRVRPARTWLTILGISIGIGAVFFLVSLGYGLQNIILEKIIFSQALLSLAVRPSSEAVNLSQKNIDLLLRLPQVENGAAEAIFRSQIALGELNGTAELRGVDAAFFDYAGVEVAAGTAYKETDEPGVVVSQAILKLFGIEDAKTILNKEIDIQILVETADLESVEDSGAEGSNIDTISVTEKYKVIGVVRDPHDSYLYIPLKELRKYVKIDHYDQIRLKVKDSKDLVVLKDVLLDGGYQVYSLEETVEQANKIFKGLRILLGIFGAIALTVSAIGMFNTMTVTLLERTNEIGIMRAIGASGRTIKSLFLTEAVIIGFLGGVTGLLIGFISSQALNFGLNSLAYKYGGTRADIFSYPYWFILMVLVLSLIIGFASGIFPARRASSMDPLDALRYK